MSEKNPMSHAEVNAIVTFDRLIAANLVESDFAIEIHKLIRYATPTWTSPQRFAFADLIAHHRDVLATVFGGMEAIKWADGVLATETTEQRESRQKLSNQELISERGPSPYAAYALNCGRAAGVIPPLTPHGTPGLSKDPKVYADAVGVCVNPLDASAAVFAHLQDLSVPFKTKYTGPILICADRHSYQTKKNLQKPDNVNRFGFHMHVQHAFVGIAWLDSVADGYGYARDCRKWYTWNLRQNTLVFKQPVPQEWFKGLGRNQFDTLDVIRQAGELMTPKEYEQMVGPVYSQATFSRPDDYGRRSASGGTWTGD